MVCTLLAGVNVVAFAADDATSVSISKFYNDAAKGGDGEHLFTKDADEISWLSSLPTWNNEGEAWKAPVSSNTTVFRCYNPTSGEHLYVDEGYADYLAGMGWNKEKLAFYSDDAKTVPVYRLWNGAEGVGSHHYTTDAGEVDWLVGQGWTKEDVAFYGVKEEANVVALVDKNGLQADGTALKGDVLAVVFGSTFGTPASIAWYRDGAVVKVIPSRIDADALLYYTGGNLESGDTPGTGVYYAVVENTKGQSFTTNPITVVDEGEAVLSDFGISDNYEAVATWVADVQAAEADELQETILKNPVACSKDNSMAVIDVTVNKLYENGKLYIVDADAETFAESEQFNDGNSISVDPEDVTDTDGNWTEVKADKFTNATLYSKGIVPGKGIYYTDKTTGATHFKFITSNPLTRGNDYVVVYATEDQPVGTDEVADFVVTDSFTAPYMMAPTSIVVTDRQGEIKGGTTGWNAQLMMGEMPAAWVTDVNAMAPLAPESSIEMYTNTSITTEGGTPFAVQSSVIAAGSTFGYEGLLPYPTCGADGQCVYAKFVGGEGIFGEDKLELTSAPVEKALMPATSMTLDESETNPYNATVSFVGLSSKASGTVYVLQGDKDNATFDKIKKKDLTKAVAYADVEGGATEVTVENVFKASDIKKTTGTDNDNNEKFVAVFVPDNTEFYTNMVAGEDDTQVFELESQIVAYTLADNTMASVTGTSVVANKIKGLNQFLEEKDLTDTAGTALMGAVAASKWGVGTQQQPGTGDVLTSTSVALAGTGKLLVTSDADGCLTLTVDAGDFVKNTYADITLATGQKLRLICQNNVTGPVDDNNPVKFAVKIINE